MSERINPFKLYHGAFIPNWLLCRPVSEISQSAKLCYARLMQYSGKNGYAFPSLATLGKEVGLSKRQMLDIMKELEVAKLVEPEKTFGKSSKYYFLKHEWMTDTDIGTGTDIGTTTGVEIGSGTGAEKGTLIESIEENHGIDSSSSYFPMENPEEEEKSLKIKKPKKEVSEIPYQQIADLYNQIFRDENIASVQKLTETRKAHIKKRWQNELKTMEDWERYFLRIKKSDFLCGKIVGNNGKPFFADFDWVINESNCIKILEDKYSNVRYEHG